MQRRTQSELRVQVRVTMFSTLIAIVYVVYYLYNKLYANHKSETKDDPRVCIVRPSLRYDLTPSSGRPSPEYFTNFRGERFALHNYSPLSSSSSTDDDSIGEEDAREEFFMWRRHGGGGWTGWNRYDD